METTKQTNQEQTNVIKKWLTSEVKFIIVIIGLVWGVAVPYFSLQRDVALIQKDIANINMNHEVHIQDIQESIKDLQQQSVDLQKQIIAIISAK